MTKIYTIEHPITNEIIYVGKTIRSLNERLTVISRIKNNKYKNRKR